MLPRSSRTRLVAGRIAAFLALFATTVAAQEVRVRAGTDPYTKGDPAALEKAGYVSFGPFPLGSNHTTLAVENLLGTEPLIWIETAHFRLGCALPEVALRGTKDWNKAWNARIKDELKQLRQHIPGIKKRVRKLDPWLRAHLMAQRLENLYAEVLDVVDREADWFPTTPDDARTPEQYRGLGPYLGMKEKFVVLLLQKGSSLARYTNAWFGFEQDMPKRHHDQEFGCMYWCASEETAGGLYRVDLALHAAIAYNVAHNLYTCYRSFSHDLPPWLVTGLAHWHSRAVTPRFPTYDRRDATDRNARSEFWEWEKRVQGLVKHEVFEPLADFVVRTDAGAFGLEQHMQAWAVADFLMATRRAETGRFLHLLKDPYHGRLRMPTEVELLSRQSDAFKVAFGAEPAELDQAFRSHVLDSKKRRRRRE